MRDVSHRTPWFALAFGTDVDGLGDDSGTTYGAMMATSTVRHLAVGCAVVAVIGIILAVLGGRAPRETAHATMTR